MDIADGSMEEGRASPLAVDWSNLPDDLLGIIRSRIAYPRGRVCFSAVCRSWRAAASQQLALPAFPLLVLALHDRGKIKKHLYCPEEGRVLHVTIPSKLRGTRFCGSYDGGWIAAIATKDTLVIVNLFSSVEVALSTKQSSMSWRHQYGPQTIWKIIFSESPTSSGCILAAMTIQGNIALCRVGCPDEGWMIRRCGTTTIGDIVFHHGELYGLSRCSEKLFKFDIDFSEDGAPVDIPARQLDVQWRSGGHSMKSWFAYIFSLSGKLAMIGTNWWPRNHKPFFKVFELAVTAEDAHDYEWKEVRTLGLGDYALFLGQACSSQMVHVQAGGHGVVRKNHIYYSSHRSMATKEYQKFNNETYLARSEHGDHIYCCKEPKSDGKERIPSVGYYITGGIDFPMWCFPPHF